MASRISSLGLMSILLGLSLPLQAQEAGHVRSNSPHSNSPQLSSQAAPEATEADVDPPLPPFPDNCDPLPLVGGEGSQVTKEVSPPSFGVPLPGPVSASTRNNWHTDWFLPTGQIYQSYMVIFMPHARRNFDVFMFLKYPDDTNQRFFRRQRVRLNANEPITVEVAPERVDLGPYQVNTNIGGVQAVGARYTVAVAGCRR
jgi:hypothetical protein